MVDIVTVENLTKAYTVMHRKEGVWNRIKSLFRPDTSQFYSLRGVSFAVRQGEILGYIGPNGAGKSTTMKILTGILVPTAGSATVYGLTPHKHRQALSYKIGVVFGQRTQLWWDLPVIDSLEGLRDIYGVPASVFSQNMAVFDRILELKSFLQRPVRQLSLGQRMRAELAGALIHSPGLIFLDEPTIGLDVVGKDQLRYLIKELNYQQGLSVVLTTHDVGDIEQLCDRILVLNEGGIIYEGDQASFKHNYSPARYLVVQFSEPVPEELEVARAHVQREGPSRFRIQFHPDAISVGEIIGTLGSRHPIRDLGITEPSLEQGIKALYTEANVQK